MGPHNQSIEQLSAQVEKSTRKAPLPAARKHRPQLWLTLVILVASVGIWSYHFFDHLSADAIYGDLQTLIEQSRDNVERYVNDQQQLPERLSNPGLAVLVSYQPQPGAEETNDFPYRLTTQAGRFLLTWDSRNPEQYVRKGE